MILKINPIRPEPKLIKIAADAIKTGELVAFPTETVYGLGADALNEAACNKIFAAKGRPQDNPLIVHVDSIKMAESVGEIPKEYRQILNETWPSPITVIIKRKGALPKAVTAGLNTVAVRIPAHPIALALIKEANTPIAAPSANLSGKPSPTEAKTIIEELGEKVAVIIDGGPTFFGLESTVIDLDSFTIIRPGPFTPEEIAKKFGKNPKVYVAPKNVQKPISPGLKYRHYAPDKPLFLFSGKPIELAKISNGIDKNFCIIGSNELCDSIYNKHALKIRLGARSNPYEIAKNLFSAIRSVDKYEIKFGICETFSDNGIGLAIMNRLGKACGGNAFSNVVQLKKLIKINHV